MNVNSTAEAPAHATQPSSSSLRPAYLKHTRQKSRSAEPIDYYSSPPTDFKHPVSNTILALHQSLKKSSSSSSSYHSSFSSHAAATRRVSGPPGLSLGVSSNTAMTRSWSTTPRRNTLLPEYRFPSPLSAKQADPQEDPLSCMTTTAATSVQRSASSPPGSYASLIIPLNTPNICQSASSFIYIPTTTELNSTSLQVPSSSLTTLVPPLDNLSTQQVPFPLSPSPPSFFQPVDRVVEQSSSKTPELEKYKINNVIVSYVEPLSPSPRKLGSELYREYSQHTLEAMEARASDMVRELSKESTSGSGLGSSSKSDSDSRSRLGLGSGGTGSNTSGINESEFDNDFIRYKNKTQLPRASRHRRWESDSEEGAYRYSEEEELEDDDAPTMSSSSILGCFELAENMSLSQFSVESHVKRRQEQNQLLQQQKHLERQLQLQQQQQLLVQSQESPSVLNTSGTATPVPHQNTPTPVPVELSQDQKLSRGTLAMTRSGFQTAPALLYPHSSPKRHTNSSPFGGPLEMPKKRSKSASFVNFFSKTLKREKRSYSAGSGPNNNRSTSTSKSGNNSPKTRSSSGSNFFSFLDLKRYSLTPRGSPDSDCQITGSAVHAVVVPKANSALLTTPATIAGTFTTYTGTTPGSTCTAFSGTSANTTASGCDGSDDGGVFTTTGNHNSITTYKNTPEPRQLSFIRVGETTPPLIPYGDSSFNNRSSLDSSPYPVSFTSSPPSSPRLPVRTFTPGLRLQPSIALTRMSTPTIPVETKMIATATETAERGAQDLVAGAVHVPDQQQQDKHECHKVDAGHETLQRPQKRRFRDIFQLPTLPKSRTKSSFTSSSQSRSPGPERFWAKRRSSAGRAAKNILPTIMDSAQSTSPQDSSFSSPGLASPGQRSSGSSSIQSSVDINVRPRPPPLTFDSNSTHPLSFGPSAIAPPQPQTSLPDDITVTAVSASIATAAVPTTPSTIQALSTSASLPILPPTTAPALRPTHSRTPSSATATSTQRQSIAPSLAGRHSLISQYSPVIEKATEVSIVSTSRSESFHFPPSNPASATDPLFHVTGPRILPPFQHGAQNYSSPDLSSSLMATNAATGTTSGPFHEAIPLTQPRLSLPEPVTERNTSALLQLRQQTSQLESILGDIRFQRIMLLGGLSSSSSTQDQDYATAAAEALSPLSQQSSISFLSSFPSNPSSGSDIGRSGSILYTPAAKIPVPASSTSSSHSFKAALSAAQATTNVAPQTTRASIIQNLPATVLNKDLPRLPPEASASAPRSTPTEILQPIPTRRPIVPLSRAYQRQSMPPMSSSGTGMTIIPASKPPLSVPQYPLPPKPVPLPSSPTGARVQHARSHSLPVRFAQSGAGDYDESEDPATPVTNLLNEQSFGGGLSGNGGIGGSGGINIGSHTGGNSVMGGTGVNMSSSGAAFLSFATPQNEAPTPSSAILNSDIGISSSSSSSNTPASGNAREPISLAYDQQQPLLPPPQVARFSETSSTSPTTPTVLGSTTISKLAPPSSYIGGIPLAENRSASPASSFRTAPSSPLKFSSTTPTLAPTSNDLELPVMPFLRGTTSLSSSLPTSRPSTSASDADSYFSATSGGSRHSPDPLAQTYPSSRARSNLSSAGSAGIGMGLTGVQTGPGHTPTAEEMFSRAGFVETGYDVSAGTTPQITQDTTMIGTGGTGGGYYTTTSRPYNPNSSTVSTSGESGTVLGSAFQATTPALSTSSPLVSHASSSLITTSSSLLVSPAGPTTAAASSSSDRHTSFSHDIGSPSGTTVTMTTATSAPTQPQLHQTHKRTSSSPLLASMPPPPSSALIGTYGVGQSSGLEPISSHNSPDVTATITVPSHQQQTTSSKDNHHPQQQHQQPLHTRDFRTSTGAEVFPVAALNRLSQMSYQTFLSSSSPPPHLQPQAPLESAADHSSVAASMRPHSMPPGLLSFPSATATAAANAALAAAASDLSTPRTSLRRSKEVPRNTRQSQQNFYDYEGLNSSRSSQHSATAAAAAAGHVTGTVPQPPPHRVVSEHFPLGSQPRRAELAGSTPSSTTTGSTTAATAATTAVDRATNLAPGAGGSRYNFYDEYSPTGAYEYVAPGGSFSGTTTTTSAGGGNTDTRGPRTQRSRISSLGALPPTAPTHRSTATPLAASAAGRRKSAGVGTSSAPTSRGGGDGGRGGTGASRQPFNRETVQQLLELSDVTLRLDELDMPPAERLLLEKFVDALAKLSTDISADRYKRREGVRRLHNALRAIEGWI